MNGTLTPAAFLAWLATFDMMDIIGQACDPHACPLATWLGATTGATWQVDAYTCDATDGRQMLTPEWMAAFVTLLDRYADYHHIDGVYAGTAQELLRDSLRWEGIEVAI